MRGNSANRCSQTSLLLLLSCAVAGCKKPIPRENGIYWDCVGFAKNKNPALGEIPVGPSGQRILACGNPGLPMDLIIGGKDGCGDKCKAAFMVWGFNIDGWECVIQEAVPTTLGNCREGSLVFYNGGPEDFSLSTGGTATVAVDGKQGSSDLSGKVGLTFYPRDCAGPTCAVMISTLSLTASDFAIDGHPVQSGNVQNRGQVFAAWKDDGTFEIPPGVLAVTANFSVDSNPGSLTLTNRFETLRGKLARDGSGFSLDSGTLVGDEGSLGLSLAGSVTGRPPVAALDPTSGTFECDDPTGVAHVSFSSVASSDPDGDLVSRAWEIDDVPAGDDITLEEVFSIGDHRVSLTVADSRTAVDRKVAQISVVDTKGPNLTGAVTPDCIWPPNHKLVLFELGNGIDVKATDACSATTAIRVVNVTSNQPPLGGRWGTSNPDVRFGSGAFCIRNDPSVSLKEDREYSVTLEARDGAENITTKTVVVRMPGVLDLPEVLFHRPECWHLDPARVVEDDDSRCVASAPGSASAPGPTTSPVEPPVTPPVPKGCSTSGGAPQAPWSVALFMLVVFGVRRRVWMPLSLLVLVGFGCQSGNSTVNSGAVAGDVQGTSFSPVGLRANWTPDRALLTTELKSYDTICGSTSNTPKIGETLIEAVVSIPRALAKPGTYAIETDPTSDSGMGVGVTRYTMDSGGKIQQTTVLIRSGTVRLDEVGTRVVGRMDVNESGVRLSGSFTATICK